MPACLDDNTAAEFASGSLPPAAAARVESHLACCRTCRMLVAALAPEPGEPGDDSQLDTTPHQPRPALGKRGRGLSTRAAGPGHTTPSAPATGDPGPAPGEVIGRYQVLGRLGAGGMGVVLSAYDPQLDRKLALKLLRPGSGLSGREARARLVREAQAIAQLAHPHVIAVFDVGTTAAGQVYVAMELVDGETLTRWLRAWERPWRDVLEVFLQAGRGLVAAHAVGLLHRDFKPDNVLVGADGRVRVTDFGLARSLLGTDEPFAPAPVSVQAGALHQSLTATGAVLGTPRYMAPEQLRGDDADARADQFSFCVALYEAVYGRHPLPGGTAQQMVDAGARAADPPDGPAPPWLGRALMRGLDPAPARRYPSMSALLGELAPPPARASRRWAVLGVGAALALSGGAMAWVAGDRAPAPMSPAERERLMARVVELEATVRQLHQDIVRRGTQETELRQVRAQLIAAEQEIEALRGRLAVIPDAPATAAASPTAPPAPRRPVPAIPAAQRAVGAGLTEAEAAASLGGAQADVLDCLAEWASRHPGDRRSIAVTLSVLPAGRTHSVDAPSLNADPTVDCVALAIGRTRFPPRAAQTRLRVTVRLDAGELRLVPQVLAVDAAPQMIDLAGVPAGGAPP